MAIKLFAMLIALNLALVDCSFKSRTAEVIKSNIERIGDEFTHEQLLDIAIECRTNPPDSTGQLENPSDNTGNLPNPLGQTDNSQSPSDNSDNYNSQSPSDNGDNYNSPNPSPGHTDTLPNPLGQTDNSPRPSGSSGNSERPSDNSDNYNSPSPSGSSGNSQSPSDDRDNLPNPSPGHTDNSAKALVNGKYMLLANITITERSRNTNNLNVEYDAKNGLVLVRDVSVTLWITVGSTSDDSSNDDRSRRYYGSGGDYMELTLVFDKLIFELKFLSGAEYGGGEYHRKKSQNRNDQTGTECNIDKVSEETIETIAGYHLATHFAEVVLGKN